MKKSIRGMLLVCLAVILMAGSVSAFASNIARPTAEPFDGTPTAKDDLTSAAPIWEGDIVSEDYIQQNEVAAKAIKTPSVMPFETMDKVFSPEEDVWVENLLRGDYPPGTYDYTTLPYTGSGTISSYVYSTFKFKPSSAGEIYTVFNGTINTGTAEVVIHLYDCDQNKIVADYSLGSGSSWGDNSVKWYYLDTSHYYCFKVTKTNSSTNTLTFTLAATK